ncbi:MAG: hypothetical protein EAZ43_12710 [Betaproteobacteria bacterium]|nr:MAG: hypothetical protein EAZ43_12710 [Betaproteobacteria bacterium]
MNSLQQQQLEAELAANLGSARIEWTQQVREELLQHVEQRKSIANLPNQLDQAAEADLLLALDESRKDVAAGRVTIESPADHVARIKNDRARGKTVTKNPAAEQTPNAETQAAMRKARAMIFPKTPRFSTADEMFAELDAIANSAHEMRTAAVELGVHQDFLKDCERHTLESVQNAMPYRNNLRK